MSARPIGAAAIEASFKKSLLSELERELRNLTAVWFPRCVDRDHGGFLCDFDYRWKPAGSQKMLEHQARQTMAAARAAAYSPDLISLREVAAHGFRYLKETMWDRQYGGWYRTLDRTGHPLEGATKHGHGTSYAISACVACYELTGDTECLELAKLAFSWLEDHAHDKKHGGYFVFYAQSGTPILSNDGAPVPGASRDAIGTPIGFKDANTTSDLLKCFSDLYRVWPDALLAQRLDETLCILRDRLVVAPGVMHMYAHVDWTPLPDVARYGQILRSANHFLEAPTALAGGPSTARAARSMVDRMLEVAWDPGLGGFHLAGSAFGPSYVENSVVFVRSKCWWPQAEGMRALAALARLYPADDPGYAQHFVRLWDYVKQYVIDARRGGWLAAGRDTNPEAIKQPKGTMWKDSSHETDALLDAIATLRSL